MFATINNTEQNRIKYKFLKRICILSCTWSYMSCGLGKALVAS